MIPTLEGSEDDATTWVFTTVWHKARSMYPSAVLWHSRMVAHAWLRQSRKLAAGGLRQHNGRQNTDMTIVQSFGRHRSHGTWTHRLGIEIMMHLPPMLRV